MKDKIKENMEVVGFDGDHLGTVDCIVGDFIELKKRYNGHGEHKKHHHCIALNLVEGVEDHKVRLSVDADIAAVFEERKPEGTVE